MAGTVALTGCSCAAVAAAGDLAGLGLGGEIGGRVRADVPCGGGEEETGNPVMMRTDERRKRSSAKTYLIAIVAARLRESLVTCGVTRLSAGTEWRVLEYRGSACRVYRGTLGFASRDSRGGCRHMGSSDDAYIGACSFPDGAKYFSLGDAGSLGVVDQAGLALNLGGCRSSGGGGFRQAVASGLLIPRQPDAPRPGKRLIPVDRLSRKWAKIAEIGPEVRQEIEKSRRKRPERENVREARATTYENESRNSARSEPSQQRCWRV